MTVKRSAGSGPLTDIRLTLRQQAAVVAWFDESSLVVLGSDADVDIAISDFLIEDCRRVLGPDGQQHWALDDHVRRRTFRELGNDGLKAALRVTTDHPVDAVRQALVRAVEPETPRDVMATRDSVAADLQVAQWLTGLVSQLPDVD